LTRVIEHVSFEMPRRQAQDCAAFYELLGFAQVEPPAGLGERSIWLTRGASSIHLMFRGRNGTDLTESPQPGAGHLALVVDAYDNTVAALEAAGVSVEPRTAYWGSPRSYLRDPAGNRIELMAFGPSAGVVEDDH
jgi:catechol 2,3-dioxygenase-like lactoylglutathione lyase family enzyme